LVNRTAFDLAISPGETISNPQYQQKLDGSVSRFNHSSHPAALTTARVVNMTERRIVISRTPVIAGMSA
jgi:hypothetical protein